MQFVLKSRRLTSVSVAYAADDGDSAEEQGVVTDEQAAEAKALQDLGNDLAEAGDFGKASRLFSKRVLILSYMPDDFPLYIIILLYLFLNLLSCYCPFWRRICAEII